MLYPVTNIQRFSTHDGPGIRTTVFFKGCPMRCKWCHNPETQQSRQQIFFTEGNCIGCRACFSACKNQAHFLDDKKRHCFDISKCTGCLACVDVCPSNGVEAVSHLMSADKIIEIVMKDKPFYGELGGITLSGGEPLLHAEGCIELLSLAKHYGLSTAIETSGYFEEAYVERIARLTDLFLWDFKDGNAIRHMENTGVSNEKSLHNLQLLDEFETKILLRCIMIKGVNMDDENLMAIAAAMSQMKHCTGVELLPYHPFGGPKNKQLGYEDNGRKEWIPSQDDLQMTRRRLEELGARVNY